MVSSLLLHADDGKKFYAAVMARLEPLNRSINSLCATSGIAFTTLWRMNRGSRPEIGTIQKLEKTLKMWERPDHQPNASNVRPTARL